MLCWMSGNTKRNKVTNEDIRSKVGISLIKKKM